MYLSSFPGLSVQTTCKPGNDACTGVKDEKRPRLPLPPVSSRGDEVEAAVDPGVWDHLLTAHAHLLVQVPVKLVIHVFQDRRPAVQIEMAKTSKTSYTMIYNVHVCTCVHVTLDTFNSLESIKEQLKEAETCTNV